MLNNITLELDAELLRKVRIVAAKQGSSISALLAAKLEEIVQDHEAYARGRRRALARLRKGFDLGWSPPQSRNELHER